MNSKRQFINLNQEIQDSWIWQEKPFSYGQAWLSLVFMARGAKSYRARGEVIKCQQGEFITSENKLADEFGWSRTRLRNFFELLEEDDRVKLEKDSTKTKVIVSNYDVYVKFQTSRKPPAKPKEPVTSEQKLEKRLIEERLVGLFPELTPTTSNEYSRLYRLVNEFYAKEATIKRLDIIYETYKKNWPDIDIHPEGMLKHWNKLKMMHLEGKKRESVVTNAS